MTQFHLTAVIERETDGYIALWPEADIASQGGTMKEARRNLREAAELFLESASPSELNERLAEHLLIEPLEVTIG